MKRILTIMLALLLLAACGGMSAPSSQKQPSPGGGPVASQPRNDPAPASKPNPEPIPESDPDENSALPDAESQAPGAGENSEDRPSNRFVTTLTDVNEEALSGNVEFTIEFPDDWTASDNLIYDADGRQIIEILPSIAFAGESVYDTLAARYPDSEAIPVTVGGLSGRFFYEQTPMNDPAFPTGFKNEIVYYLERGDELFSMRFTPAYGVGVGTQRENFQAQIKAIT